jgi:hypothetical protein
MKFLDHLDKDTREKLKGIRKRRRKKKVFFPEKLKRRDIEDLMGIHRDTYMRSKGGAIKKK